MENRTNPYGHPVGLLPPWALEVCSTQAAHHESPWLGLFGHLRKIDWLNLRCGPTPVTSSDGTVFQCSGRPTADISVTPLGRRLMLSFDRLASVRGKCALYGYYWNILRIELRTDEILLVDPAYSFDTDAPKTTFETARQVWLSPELGLQQFCQRLSGVSRMIFGLAHTEQASEERVFLAAEISGRIEKVLGPPAVSSALHSFSPPLKPEYVSFRGL
ncbi:uncharacterized protein GIQ15_01639 [Arthroderma uncinatum]|uniref:uncharacterized protein n=1 Tax=Arthroderma uncinatum TaxID=74035 RepID=UPI00144A6207|nr:uncharacterized protein GIQ15_01639 [Arthroderma uncinatum]KAF3492122.1 hypothetical protein GIQ15_01639 [Arthroderma uncinatum]